MAEARAVLRSLLRTVHAQLTSVSGNRLWHDEVMNSKAAVQSLTLQSHMCMSTEAAACSSSATCGGAPFMWPTPVTTLCGDGERSDPGAESDIT